MREHPWHIRRPSTHHHLWYQNLLELHRLTQEWLGELSVERPSHFLGHTASPEVREMVLRLEEATEQVLHAESEGGLASLLDDQLPEALLTRLQHSVEMLQAWTLRSILDRSKDSELPALVGILEQASWRKGRGCASARYSGSKASPREDLRGVLAAVQGLPLHPSREGKALLVERATRGEVRLELLHCPHQSRNAAVLAVADPLCGLQDQWIRGYLYELNPRIRVEKDRTPEAEGRCRHRWWLPVQ